MDILLDTQAFIWLINNDRRLGQKTTATLHNTDHTLYLSHFSLFEMTIKAQAGKLIVDYSIFDELPRVGIQLLAPNIRSYKKYKIFNTQNQDPFDNILIATAITERLTLATSDQKILGTSYPPLKTLNIIM